MPRGIKKLGVEEAAKILTSLGEGELRATKRKDEPIYSLYTLKPTNQKESDRLIDFEITLSRGERVGLFR